MFKTPQNSAKQHPYIFTLKGFGYGHGGGGDDDRSCSTRDL